MNKILGFTVIMIVLLSVAWFVFRSHSSQTEGDGAQDNIVAYADYMDAAYSIEGTRVKINDGIAETTTDPLSASTLKTRYFGNELRTDLNGDGREDIAFIITQSSGGSGTFYYAVAALNTPRGYVGSDGYLLGDRVSPQATTISSDPTHKYVVVFNYAVRGPGQPMTAQPSVGKSTYLKLNPHTMQWAIVLSPEDRQAL